MTDTAPAELDPTPEAPVAEAADTSTEAIEAEAPQAEAQFLPVDDYRDHLVPVKVDGEELTVPVSELLDGYSRHADYTRKTTALAEERRQLATAAAIAQGLAQDPQGTIKVLAEVYGADVAGEVAAASGVATPEVDDPVLQPFAQKLSQVEKWMEEQQTQARLAALQSDLDRVTAQYGLTEEDVVMAAVQLNTQNLDLVAQSLAYQRAQGVSQVQAEADAAREQKIEGKRAAAVIHGGGTNPAASLGAPTTFNSPEEAGRAALKQLGYG